MQRLTTKPYKCMLRILIEDGICICQSIIDLVQMKMVNRHLLGLFDSVEDYVGKRGTTCQNVKKARWAGKP